MADVVKTIGATGRDYATPALWFAAVPTNVTTAGGDNYRGEAYNDAEFTSASTLLTMSGKTTSVAHKIIFTAASGQSFKDHVNVRTNALKYNQANGVALRCTGNYGGDVIIVDNANIQITRIQAKGDGTGNGSNVPLNCEGASTSNILLMDCISNVNAKEAFKIYGSGCYAINISGFLSGSAGNGCTVKNGSTAIGCQVVRDSAQTPAGTGAVSAYTNSILQSCAFFGFSTVASASNWDTTNSKNNATDKASGLPGSNNQHSVTYTSTAPFTNATTASQNLIPISSSSLINNGFRDATNAPNDITGTARSATPTIGAWEVSGAVAAAYKPTAAMVWIGGDT